MNKIFRLICFAAMAFCMLAIQGCGDKKKVLDEDGNAVYYWRTVFRLNQYEEDFIKKHNITKMYVKFFDVDVDWNGNAVPLGTTIFIDSIPSYVQIVPTIFITSDAIAVYPQFIDKMLQRVIDMAEVNGIKFSEIQIDCDWMESSSEKYFAFMKELKVMLEPKGIDLSTTVRLFQLGYEVPEADYGVLMCYNIGDINEWRTDNSILDTKDIKPYMNKLAKFKMPLSVAFPCFEWDVSFSEEKDMMGIEHDKLNLSDEKHYKKLSDNRYEILDDSDYGWAPKYIRHEDVSLDEILDAKKIILKEIHSSPLQFVMYHLDSINLSKFSDDDVEKIYR